MDLNVNKVLYKLCLISSHCYNLVPMTRIEKFSCGTVGEETREFIGDRREERLEEKRSQKRREVRREEKSEEKSEVKRSGR